jgi:hypothetical protein
MRCRQEKPRQEFSRESCVNEATLKPRPKWKDNVDMNFEEKVCEGVDWIKLPRDTISVVSS